MDLSSLELVFQSLQFKVSDGLYYASQQTTNIAEKWIHLSRTIACKHIQTYIVWDTKFGPTKPTEISRNRIATEGRIGYRRVSGNAGLFYPLVDVWCNEGIGLSICLQSNALWILF